jgi:acetoin utilization deacetylase AcuC-like enzyme
MPYLVLDPLGGRPPSRDRIRRAVRAILTEKYAHLVDTRYVERVVQSFADHPVRLREPRYVKAGAPIELPRSVPADQRIALVVNEEHDIHHVRERGYVEAPVRVQAILRRIEPSGLFERRRSRTYPDRHLLAVHDAGFVSYLRRACAVVPRGRSVYPYVFPIRNASRPPKELTVRAGYYCIDTFTPLNEKAYLAARRAVDCTLTAADQVLHGRRIAYALVRPPGHHAERASFGGFCYFNNCAIAAQYLSTHGKVAILDIDYHHGNGQQQIFLERSDVLTVSIHGHPSFAYPYFTGFADERGRGAGAGGNLNLALPERLDGAGYRPALARALDRVRRHAPTFLVVALGLDPARGDPTGTWSLSAGDFRSNGVLIGELNLPTLVIQEGGYRARTLGANALAFFAGLHDGVFGAGTRG